MYQIVTKFKLHILPHLLQESFWQCLNFSRNQQHHATMKTIELPEVPQWVQNFKNWSLCESSL